MSQQNNAILKGFYNWFSILVFSVLLCHKSRNHFSYGLLRHTNCLLGSSMGQLQGLLKLTGVTLLFFQLTLDSTNILGHGHPKCGDVHVFVFCFEKESLCGTSMPSVFKAWRYKGFCQGGLVWIIPRNVLKIFRLWILSCSFFFLNPGYPAKSYPQEQNGSIDAWSKEVWMPKFRVTKF